MSARARRGEAGFTLIETLIAILILVIGIAAIANLFVVAGLSNRVANAMTTSANLSQEAMERLKAIPFKNIVPGGNLDSDAGSVSNCNDATEAGGCVTGTNYNSGRAIPGVGDFKTRWLITSIDAQMVFIQVRTDPVAYKSGQPVLTPIWTRGRAEFATFRVCTTASAGCP